MLQILQSSTPPALTALLPLFYEKADTLAMVKHGMDLLKRAITFLNPHQLPVITVDQPLSALPKMVQWKWPASHRELAYVVMMGGLHIKMALWNVLGNLLEGWEETKKTSPTFLFWNAILHYQTLVLVVVRSQHQHNFVLYVEALEELVLLFFSLEHTNYVWWMPIHIQDMKSLPDSIIQKFCDECQFVLS